MFIQACMTIFDKQRAYAKNSKHVMSGRGRVKVLTFSLINRNAKWAFRKTDTVTHFVIMTREEDSNENIKSMVGK